MANSSFFTNARDTVIDGFSSFNSVAGNQIINNTQYVFDGMKKKEPTDYDEFFKVKRGAIIRHRTVHRGEYRRAGYPRAVCSGNLEAERTIWTVEVITARGAIFTQVVYSGPDAIKAFEEDFQSYSESQSCYTFQLYGYTLSDIPSLIFHNDLQPAANFLHRLGIWAQFYLASLMEQWNCHDDEIWLDPKIGVLCRGPQGPDCKVPRRFFDLHDLPPNVELLRDNNCLRFFASFKSKDIDKVVVDAIARRWIRGNSDAEVSQPTVVSMYTDRIVAVGGIWWTSIGNLVERVMMDNGETRFLLNHDGIDVCLHTHSGRGQEAWLLQASSIFHALGVSPNDDLSQYKLILPGMDLMNSFPKSETGRREPLPAQPIYLFLRSFSPLTTAPHQGTPVSHYWSFDPAGGNPLSWDTCYDFGLPVGLYLQADASCQTTVWDNRWYKMIHQYQLARGFDPRTSDFARFLGYPVYRVQNNSNRPEEPSTELTQDTTTTPTVYRLGLMRLKPVGTKASTPKWTLPTSCPVATTCNITATTTVKGSTRFASSRTASSYLRGLLAGK